MPTSIRIKIDLTWLSWCQKRARWPRVGRESGRVTMPLVLSLIGQQPAQKWKSVPSLPNSLVAVLAVGISLALSRSLTVSPTLKRQLESGSLTINGILETRTVREGMSDNDSRINSFRDAHGRPSDLYR